MAHHHHHHHHHLPAIAILSPLIIASLIASILSFNGVNGEVIAAQRQFDYFILALQWPGTYCRRTKTCCKTNGCCRGSTAPMEFTIHGLWPNYNDGSWPSCCTNFDFDEKEISTLLDGLDKYWPTLSCGSPSSCHGHKGSFWAHEWEKHGTCAAPVIRDEYDYFLTALNVYFKYNVTKVLTEAGYVPSNSEKYPLGGIISAIENAFHASPVIVCSSGAVQELHLCFYKNFKPRECVTTYGVKEEVDSSNDSCPKYVSLPVYMSSGQILSMERKGLNTGATLSQLRPKIEAL